MATLSGSDLATVRQGCAGTFAGVDYTKTQVNAALQAIEDTMTTRTGVVGDLGKTIPQLVSAAIDAASSPYVFSNAQKKVLFAWWADTKFNRDK